VRKTQPNDPSPIGQLRAIAKAAKRPVRRVNMFDPDVCGEFNVEEALARAEPPPDRLRSEVSLPFAGQRFVLRGSDRYLTIDLVALFAAGTFSVNRSSRSIAYFNGEMKQGSPIGSHPVFVPANDADPAVLEFAGVREAILAMCLGVDEGLTFDGTRVSAVLRPGPRRQVADVLPSLARLASALPRHVEEPLSFADLPDEFHPLIPLIKQWGIADDDVRSKRMEKASRRQLQALVERLSPYFGAINDYLDSFGDRVPASACALGTLAEAACEARLILNGSHLR
jgi:hypothetical protein